MKLDCRMDVVKPFMGSMIAAGLMAAGSALAADVPPLAPKYGCTNCHAVDVKMIGPSWMGVSKAYNNNDKTSIGVQTSDILKAKTPEEWLKYKISHGGAGNWGTVIMPATDPTDKFQGNVDKMVTAIMGLSDGSTSKDEMLKLANKYYCTGCHAIDKKEVGPSWMDVSKAYNSNGTTTNGVKVADILKAKTPEEYLTTKISHGGLGNWGNMFMPAIEYRDGSTTQDDPKKHEEIQELVKFVLGLAKK